MGPNIIILAPAHLEQKKDSYIRLSSASHSGFYKQTKMYLFIIRNSLLHGLTEDGEGNQI
jgi:hypothetical protein